MRVIRLVWAGAKKYKFSFLLCEGPFRSLDLVFLLKYYRYPQDVTSRSENTESVSSVPYASGILAALPSFLIPLPLLPSPSFNPWTSPPFPQPAKIKEKGERGYSRSTGVLCRSFLHLTLFPNHNPLLPQTSDVLSSPTLPSLYIPNSSSQCSSDFEFEAFEVFYCVNIQWVWVLGWIT